MKRFLFIASLMLVLAASLMRAEAQETKLICNENLKTDMFTKSDEGFCDFYQRQLNFKPIADKMAADMKERQQSYYAPRKAAYDAYLEDLGALNAMRGEEADGFRAVETGEPATAR